jgi:hypothetical protein
MDIQSIQPADVVKHNPSGETWVIAAVNGDEVMPCGWPESIAKAKDCVIVKKATDEAKQKMIESWAGKHSGDLRSLWNSQVKS